MAIAAALALSACNADSGTEEARDRRTADLSPADRARLEALGYEPWVEERRPPQDTGVVLHRDGATAGGFILYASRGAQTAELIDRDGAVLNRWTGPQEGGYWSDTELLPDGSLVVVGATSERRDLQQSARYLRRLAWDSTLLWEADFPAHHDVEMLADGRLLTLSSEVRTILDGNTERTILDDEIVLTNADGEVLESYSIADAYLDASAGVEPPRLAVRPAMVGDLPGADVFHANSVEWIDVPEHVDDHPIYQTGNVLISMRHQHRIAVLSRDERRIIWTWGKGVLDGQHSARMLPSGNILIFDNGLARKASRILEVDPRSETVVWDFSSDDRYYFYTAGGGASQRLPNGNTLATYTSKGRLFEVTAAGEVVWQFVNPTPERGRARRATIHASKWLPADDVLPILRQHD